ncbi:HNH endonuclease [archaeon]|mgnify:CR=1 FL=1|jgi:5-methylcytosine-specific restriction endonuclease McrA|nr:HNH endonuclease [archaeon]MBT3450410.1 HNH endonuclease [archaeon]MBT6868502.1 HNH endonuclease [archaeon]MBT7193282.1 HNH endonuclease [archaeon]MBT7380059.1 HNH endonuclease [archaeon]
MFNDLLTPKKRRKNSSFFGESLDIGLGPKKEKKISTREHIPMIWKDKILMKQNNKCAGKDCAKLHNGKKLMVNNRNDFDHIKPLALGGKNVLNNLQALCPGCHRFKTREDRYNISKKNKKVKETKKDKSPLEKSIFDVYSKRKKYKSPFDLKI